MRRFSDDLFWKESSLAADEGSDFSAFSPLQSAAFEPPDDNAPIRIVAQAKANNRPDSNRDILRPSKSVHRTRRRCRI